MPGSSCSFCRSFDFSRRLSKTASINRNKEAVRSKNRESGGVSVTANSQSQLENERQPHCGAASLLFDFTQQVPGLLWLLESN